MVVNRETLQHILTEFLHEIKAGQCAVTAGGTNKPDIPVLYPRLRQVL